VRRPLTSAFAGDNDAIVRRGDDWNPCSVRGWGLPERRWRAGSIPGKGVFRGAESAFWETRSALARSRAGACSTVALYSGPFWALYCDVVPCSAQGGIHRLTIVRRKRSPPKKTKPSLGGIRHVDASRRKSRARAKEVHGARQSLSLSRQPSPPKAEPAQKLLLTTANDLIMSTRCTRSIQSP
jgi:hypothetical protein